MSLAALVLVAATPALPQGDPVRGKEIYGRCGACHSLARNRTGPKHCGLFGRAAGGVAGFRYSKAMRDSGIVWTRDTLDAFLKDPRGLVPGTRMGYAGVDKSRDRADLIAYLEAVSRSKESCR